MESRAVRAGGAPQKIGATSGMAIISGNNDANTLFGDVGGAPQADTISGLGGNDQLYGLGGNDTLDGGDGDDLLRGGADFRRTKQFPPALRRAPARATRRAAVDRIDHQ